MICTSIVRKWTCFRYPTNQLPYAAGGRTESYSVGLNVNTGKCNNINSRRNATVIILLTISISSACIGW